MSSVADENSLGYCRIQTSQGVPRTMRSASPQGVFSLYITESVVEYSFAEDIEAADFERATAQSRPATSTLSLLRVALGPNSPL